jgi:YVTN family beta-propeller protein
VGQRGRFVPLLVAVTAVLAIGLAVDLFRSSGGDKATSTTTSTPVAASTSGYPGMPAVADPSNIYSQIGPNDFAPGLASTPPRVYVPNGRSNTISVIDPATLKVLRTFKATGKQPQHIVVSYDLRTLWILNDQGNSVQPIDAATGTVGTTIKVDDPYNMYFTPDGASAFVVAEARRRLDFRDPHTMALQEALPVPDCAGINHTDYSANGSYLLATCEFAGKLAKIDIQHRKVLGILDLTAHPVAGQPVLKAMRMQNGQMSSSMPQDVRAGPDGHHFYVADMMAGGVFVVDGDSFTVQRFIPTGIGAHGITPSRDGKLLYVANRGSTMIGGPPHGPGSVSVLDPATGKVIATWVVPGGGSPDMGNLNAAGTQLWLSGRYDGEVYVFDTVHGGLMARIPVGQGPHGLAVWPQPGRYSLGHTGNMR